MYFCATYNNKKELRVLKQCFSRLRDKYLDLQYRLQYNTYDWTAFERMFSNDKILDWLHFCIEQKCNLMKEFGFTEAIDPNNIKVSRVLPENDDLVALYYLDSDEMYPEPVLFDNDNDVVLQSIVVCLGDNDFTHTIHWRLEEIIEIQGWTEFSKILKCKSEKQIAHLFASCFLSKEIDINNVSSSGSLHTPNTF